MPTELVWLTSAVVMFWLVGSAGILMSRRSSSEPEGSEWYPADSPPRTASEWIRIEIIYPVALPFGLFMLSVPLLVACGYSCVYKAWHSIISHRGSRSNIRGN